MVDQGGKAQGSLQDVWLGMTIPLAWDDLGTPRDVGTDQRQGQQAASSLLLGLLTDFGCQGPSQDTAPSSPSFTAFCTGVVC